LVTAIAAIHGAVHITSTGWPQITLAETGGSPEHVRVAPIPAPLEGAGVAETNALAEVKPRRKRDVAG
jgi:hypothetical protein